jgi:hypothetical protein
VDNRWINEYEIPSLILGLLGVPDLPIDLRQEIERAKNEVETQGAVTYPTKARIHFYLHKYADFIENLDIEDETNSQLAD